MERAVLLQTLDGHELRPLACTANMVHDFTGAAVQQHRAGAAVRRVAADVGAGEPQILADEVDEQQARLDVGLVLLAVDGELDRVIALTSSPSWRAHAPGAARAGQHSTRSRLYSADPRRSSLGSAAAAASSRGLA